MLRSYVISVSFLTFFCYFFGQERPKIGLVLSGGGAKGFAHIGVLKYIDEHNIPIDYIAGTSMGAIIGGLYAYGYSANEIDSIAKSTDFQDLFFKEINRKEISLYSKSKDEKYILELPFDNFKLQIPTSVSKGQGALSFLNRLFLEQNNYEDFSKLPIPFLCIGTELSTGNAHVFQSGNLAESILASAAFPTLIMPVKVNGITYTDGGISNNFPAEYLLNKNLDVIIGVDLSQGLKSEENIKGVNDLMEQINNFNILKKTKEQRQFVDILINPNLKEFSVLDFDEKAIITQRGYQAIFEKREVIDSLIPVNLRRSENSFSKSRRNVSKKFIDLVEIRNNKLFNIKYITGAMGFYKPDVYSAEEIQKMIDKLYATGNFNSISYTYDSKDSKLIVRVDEKLSNSSLRLSMHYDDVFKTGVLVNISRKKILFQNSTFSADIVLGDFSRYYLNYFVNNGFYPSVGASSNFKFFEYNYYSTPNSTPSQYILYYFENKFFVQQALSRKYALEIGGEHYYFDIFNEMTNNHLINSYYINLFSEFKADTRDDLHFPMRGLKLSLVGRYHMLSNDDNFSKNLQLSGLLDFTIPIAPKISVQNRVSFGTTIGEMNYPFRYFSGGVFFQDILNFERFFGVDFAKYSGSNRFLIYTELKLKFIKNHFLSTFANVMNLENKLEDMRFTSFTHDGVGLSYGYNSPLGPLQIFYTYSFSEKSPMLSFNLGYTF